MVFSLLAGCGGFWHPNARYAITQYTGKWSVKLSSEACGDDTLETYTSTGRMAFSAYDGTYDFHFPHGNKDRRASGAAEANVEFTNIATGEVTVREAPQFDIEFESSKYGKGRWIAKDCEGTIELTKIRG